MSDLLDGLSYGGWSAGSSLPGAGLLTFPDVTLDTAHMAVSLLSGDAVGQLQGLVAGSSLSVTNDGGGLFTLDGSTARMAAAADLSASLTKSLTFTQAKAGYQPRSHTVSLITAAGISGTALDTSALNPTPTFTEEWTAYPSLYNESTHAGLWRPRYFFGSGGTDSHTLSGEDEIYSSVAYNGVDPFSVLDGILSITADRASTAIQSTYGKTFTSGLLTTEKSFTQQYGYFEGRFCLPCLKPGQGQGNWPAFWMLPAQNPPELDIFEFTNVGTTLYTTPHYNHNSPAYVDGSSATGEPGTVATTIADVSLGYHSFGVLVHPANGIDFYFDRKRIAAAHGPLKPSMQQPFYFLINLAIGGGWAGEPNANTVYPAQLKCDWVRAYVLAS